MPRDSSTILRRFRNYTLLALASVLAVAILVTAALTARLAVGPVSVAFMGPDLRESLGEKLNYAYDVKFDDLELRWSDGHGNTGLALVDVRIADYSLQDIASVPEIIVGLSPAGIIGGDMKPKAITVVAPRIRWIKTAGGAIKFDIGADKPGDSGKILEDFLITLAAAPEPQEGEKKILPEMRIIDAEITIGNEVDNSSLLVSDADILIAPHAKGVRSTFELALNFTDLALDGLAALLPGPVPGPIMSEPVSGSIRLDMDKFFAVDAAEFDLSGKALSLAGHARLEASLVSLEAHGSLAKSSLQALSESWPAGLGREFDIWLENGGAGEGDVAVALQGSIHRFDQSLQLSGTIGSPRTPFIVSGLTDSPIVEIPAEGKSASARSSQH
jgi:hypothetical protein